MELIKTLLKVTVFFMFTLATGILCYNWMILVLTNSVHQMFHEFFSRIFLVCQFKNISSKPYSFNNNFTKRMSLLPKDFWYKVPSQYIMHKYCNLLTKNLYIYLFVFSGDCLCTYVKVESVQLASITIDGASIKAGEIITQQAWR